MGLEIRAEIQRKIIKLVYGIVSWGKKEPGGYLGKKNPPSFCSLNLIYIQQPPFAYIIPLILSLVYVHYRFVALIPETQRDPRVSDIKNDMEKVFVSVIIICLHCYQACDVRMQSVCHH